MFRKLVLGLIAVCVPVLFGSAIPVVGAIEAAPLVTEEWVARYNGPANDIDTARAMVVDANGNVYVTGRSVSSSGGTDYATVKYGAAGNELWAVRYNGPGNDADTARAMAVDADGNVYVTGKSTGLGSSTDYATVKYDAAGKELWVARYNGPGNKADDAYVLALDTAGNVFVTGESVGLGTAFDYATVKYDGATGAQLWVARYNGGNAYDRAEEMVVDADGNVYVTGESRISSDSFTDYATIKYDGATGAQLWVARYNGPENSIDKAFGMALGADGNVYVAGESRGPGTYYDYATVKYDGATGAELWVTRYNGPENFYDNRTYGMAVDADDNIYITGRSSSRKGTGSYYATVKYDGATGEELWVARYNGPANDDDTAQALTVDAGGNVYVTGKSTGPDTSYDYATVKYDGATGAELWVARYNGPGNFYDLAWAVVVDTTGNVYVTGNSTGSGTSYDYATIKYSQLPSQ